MSQYEPLYDSFSHGGHGGYVPTPRMSVSASVYLPGSDVDPQTGWLKPDRQRRCRTQGKSWRWSASPASSRPWKNPSGGK